MIILIALLTVFSTFLGGSFAVRFKDRLHLILGFSAGTVLGAALFDLIPESIELSGLNIKFISILIALGFVIYLILDRFFSIHCHDQEKCDNKNHQGQFGAVALIFHSLLDGIGIGIAFKVSTVTGLAITAAVLAHKFSDGVNIVNVIFREQKNSQKVFLWLIIGSLAPIFGIILAFLLNFSQQVLGIILAIFAGLFLYLGASDLIPESHHRHPTAWTTFTTLLGMGLILIIIILIK